MFAHLLTQLSLITIMNYKIATVFLVHSVLCQAYGQLPENNWIRMFKGDEVIGAVRKLDGRQLSCVRENAMFSIKIGDEVIYQGENNEYVSWNSIIASEDKAIIVFPVMYTQHGRSGPVWYIKSIIAKRLQNDTWKVESILEKDVIARDWGAIAIDEIGAVSDDGRYILIKANIRNKYENGVVWIDQIWFKWDLELKTVTSYGIQIDIDNEKQ